MPKFREIDEPDDDDEDIENPLRTGRITIEERDKILRSIRPEDVVESSEPEDDDIEDTETPLHTSRITIEKRDEILGIIRPKDVLESNGTNERLQKGAKELEEENEPQGESERLLDAEIKSDSVSYHTYRDLDPIEVHRLYHEEKFSPRKVAETLGVSRHMIQKVLRDLGCKSRPVGGVKKNIDHQEVYRICVEEGHPKQEAAKILGCKSIQPINRILKENDWKTPLEIKMETEIDPDEVHRLHYDEGWDFIRIANHYGYKSKDIISKLFKERDWIPTPLAKRVVYEFPAEIEEEHRIEPSRTSEVFEHLEELEDISPLDMARCIENLMSSSASEVRIKWVKVASQSKWATRATEVLSDNLNEVETSLNELLGISEDSKMKFRVGFVDGKLYIREQDTSEYNWMNIYENELFYFKTTENKFRLVHEMRARLGLSTNTHLGKLIDQLTDRESAEGSGYSDLKDYQDKHIRAETLHLLLDTIEQKIDDIQDRISCIGKGIGGIRNPRFPTDPETIDIMFAKFFGLGLSDGHIYRKHSQFVYAEKNPDRCKIVIQHSKDFGDVHYNEIVDNGVHRIQFSSVFGRVLRRRGLRTAA